MLRYIGFLKSISLLICCSFLSSGALTNEVVVNYEILWNKIRLGELIWQYKLKDSDYEITIELKSSALSSNLYP